MNPPQHSIPPLPGAFAPLALNLNLNLNLTPTPTPNLNLFVPPRDQRGLRLRLGLGVREKVRVNAFTLIELLLAISIMAIILVAINGMFFTALHLRNTAVNSLEASLPVEQALEVMEHDLSNIVCSTNTNGIFIGPLQTTNPTNALPNQIGPDFYTSGGELDGATPWSCGQVINYVLAPPTNGARGPGLDLIRAVTRNLLPIAQPTQPDEQHTILSGVQSLTFLYYDGTQWDQIWDTTQQTNLPLAIKVQIRMAPVPGAPAQAQPLELVVPVDVLLSTNTITALQ
jgi:prepilin-type N-terminal cleavage/methylation domain-containing protein